ncbi:MAG: M12 family metallo-peptidase [Phycisphaerales bacterium]|nr:M12 family metallo-peptidase [Phycisphaerales bacterium]
MTEKDRNRNFTELQYLVQEEYAAPTGVLVSINNTASSGEPFLSLLPIEGTPYIADLHPVTARSQNYQIITEDSNGKRTYLPPGVNRSIRGTLVGMPGSRVAGSLLPDGLHLRVEFAQGDIYWMEPIKSRIPSASSTDYVIYNDKDVSDCGGQCGNAVLANNFLPATYRSLSGNSTPPTSPASSGALQVCKIACEADYEFFQEFGSVSAVEDQINNIINAVNDQFEAEVGITHEITTIIVQTDADDPYTKSEASKLLNQFREHWKDENSDINRDVAKLFTGRDLNGSTIGLAFVGVICSDFSYLLVQSNFTSNFSCITDLSAHELGHTWSANHCNCDDNTMNAGLTCTNTFHPTKTIPEIESFRDSLSCLSQDNTGNEPSDCPDGQILDCIGNCIPETFLGDGFCDDGSFDFEGVPMFFDCPLYDCDYGDCDCGNDSNYGSESTYEDYDIQKGDKISGGKSKVKHVDGKYSIIDSKLYGNKQKIQVYLRLKSNVAADNLDRIDVSVELNVDTSDLTGKCYLYDNKNSKWKELAKVTLDSGFNRIQILDIGSRTKYLSSSDKIKVRFLAYKKNSPTFEIEIDRIAVTTYSK